MERMILLITFVTCLLCKPARVVILSVSSDTRESKHVVSSFTSSVDLRKGELDSFSKALVSMLLIFSRDKGNFIKFFHY